MKKTLLLLSAIILFFAGCNKDPEVTPMKVTSEVTHLGGDTVMITGSYEYMMNIEGGEFEIRYSLNEDMSSAQSEKVVPVGNDFSVTLTGLDRDKQYYYRFYFSGKYNSFETEVQRFNLGDGDDGDDSGSDSEIAGHEYVDLGLPSGLKWATCNVGAEKPEDYGDYFAWGEIETKSEYTESNSLTHGKQMDDISGDVQYDVAAANWGGSWRMPTKDEMIELVSNCEWEWILIEKNDYDSVKCYKGIGPNGNSVIFPVAGCYNGPSLISVGTGGLCWTSTPYDVKLNLAYEFYFNDYNAEVSYIGNRFIGQSVRPVSE